MKIAILAAGDYPRKPYPKYLLDSADVLVCCDSALQVALKHKLMVDAVVGDMDSISHSVMEHFHGIIVHETEQDYNDLTKAMRFVMSNYTDIESISILGATGKHEAHTIGNLSLLMTYENWWKFWEKGVTVQIVSDYCTAFAVGESCRLQVGEGRKISFFSCDKTLRIHTSGLKWPLDEVEFNLWWKATLNCATEDEVVLKMNHPSEVLVVLE